MQFDTTPAMKVREITARTIELLRSGTYRFGRLNFPSGDMVGHTGHLHATIEAMEVIDECMAELLAVVDELGGVLVYTARPRQRGHHVHRGRRRHPVTEDVTHAQPRAVRGARAAWTGEYRIDAPDQAVWPTWRRPCCCCSASSPRRLRAGRHLVRLTPRPSTSPPPPVLRHRARFPSLGDRIRASPRTDPAGPRPSTAR